MRPLVVGANRVHVGLVAGHVAKLVSSPMCPTYVLDVAQAPLDFGVAGPLSEPMIWSWAKLPTRWPLCANPKRSYWLAGRYVGQ